MILTLALGGFKEDMILSDISIGGDKLRRQVLFFILLLSLPTPSMAQSYTWRFDLSAPCPGPTIRATGGTRAMQESCNEQDCKAVQTPPQFFFTIPNMGPHLWRSSSAKQSVANLFSRYRWDDPPFGNPVLDPEIRLWGEKYGNPMPASPGFTHVTQSATSCPLAPQTLFQAPHCQAPLFHLPRSDVSTPSADPGKPLTSPRLFVGDVLHDEAHIWKFPWGVAHGHHWKPALAFTLATAGLVELDPHEAPYFRRTSAFSGFNETFSSLNTGLGEGFFPVGFFLAGHLRKDTYMERTAWLAGESLVDAEIVSEVMKNVDRRLRPRQVPPHGDFADTWFDAGGGLLINGGSFPSGHAIGAFSMATIIAERYRRHRWVPWVAYGLAALVGFSRITLQEHFPSDIFAGAVLGYAISHYVVLCKQQ